MLKPLWLWWLCLSISFLGTSIGFLSGSEGSFQVLKQVLYLWPAAPTRVLGRTLLFSECGNYGMLVDALCLRCCEVNAFLEVWEFWPSEIVSLFPSSAFHFKHTVISCFCTCVIMLFHGTFKAQGGVTAPGALHFIYSTTVRKWLSTYIAWILWNI